tara:strand:- start:424 stop:1758 length:1335 start_codon:yes stop_codon:yes gene_type:complete
MTRHASYHEYEWPDDIFTTFSHFQDSRSKDPFAEIRIFQKLPGGRANLPVTQKLNLVNGDSQKRFAKLVDEVYPVPGEWRERLTYMCSISLKAWRQGGPEAIDLASVEVDYDTEPYLLSPYIGNDAITLMYADSSAGKSMFVVACGLTVATGIPLLGEKPRATTNVLYLDWEDNQYTHKERADALLASQGVAEMPPGKFIYRQMERSLKDLETTITQLINDHKIGLVIVDSLSLAAGDPTEVQNILDVSNICNRLGPPTIVIHHVSKEAVKAVRAEDKREYGSVFIRAGARLSWIIEKEQEEDEDHSLIRLTNTKINRGKPWLPRAYRVDFLNGSDGHLATATYKQIDPYDFADVREVHRVTEDRMRATKSDRTIREFVHEVLGEAPNLDCKQIADRVDKLRGEDTGEEVIRTEMKRGEKRGLYTVTGQVGRSKLWSLRGEDPF